jgi:hypothetical protein
MNTFPVALQKAGIFQEECNYTSYGFQYRKVIT